MGAETGAIMSHEFAKLRVGGVWALSNGISIETRKATMESSSQMVTIWEGHDGHFIFPCGSQP